MPQLAEPSLDATATVPELDAAVARAIRSATAGATPDPRGVLDVPALVTGAPAGAAAALGAAGLLLVRRGEPADLTLALRLSHTVLELERSAGAPTAPSTLLRGLAQLGLGLREAGQKNVALALRAPLASPGRVLAQWGLATAALRARDVRLALSLADRWRAEADAAGLSGERSRAIAAQALLHLVRGDVPAARARLDALRTSDAPAPIVAGLAHWAATADGAAPAVPLPAPAEHTVPLLLGLDGLDPRAPSEPWADDFDALCRVRRATSAPGALAALGPERLGALLDLLAAWELPAPLAEAEAALRALDPVQHSRRRLDRILGREVARAEEALAMDPEPRVQGQATVWMTDVRGYSTLAQALTPEALFQLVSPLFKIMHQELEHAGGAILEFVGDSILVVFEALPGQRAEVERVLSATGRCMARLAWSLRLGRLAGDPEVRFGIGVARGPVATGFVGGLERCHVTALGHTVNKAARLEGLTKDLPSPAAIDASVFGPGGPDVWRDPGAVTYRLRDLGEHRLKGMSAPARVYGLAPLAPHAVDFVPMGHVVSAAEPGIVYLDVGNRFAPGILDTHAGSGAGSTCELVVRHPELVTGHLREVPPDAWEFRLHTDPDLDCCAALYACTELLEAAPRQRVLDALAAYVSRVDQGEVGGAAGLEQSLYGVFTAHQHLERARRGRELTHLHLLEAGLRVIDAACFLAEAEGGPPDLSRIFAARPGWFPEERGVLAADHARYLEDRAGGLVYEARVAGVAAPVSGLWLDHPRSLLFKLWARTDPEAPGGRGHGFLAVDWSQGPDRRRFVVSVDPTSGTSLAGLGEALERAETVKRARLGQPRPAEPRRVPTDNCDPWYFGWGHAFTIVDAPARGTVLTADEVREVHARWTPGE